jgi:hypothetical protein
VTDYLNHLIGRVLRTHAMLEPVLPSMFEPAPFTDLLTETEAEAEAPPGPASPHIASVVTAQSALMPPVADKALTPSTPPPTDVADAEVIRGREVVLEAGRVITPESPYVQVVVRRERVDFFERSAVEQHMRELRELVTERPAQPPGIPHTPSAPARQPTAHPTLAAPMASPLRHRPRREALNDSGTKPEVRISIGRVDVRAVIPSATPPPHPRATARPADAMSLQTYLADRDGRRR